METIRVGGRKVTYIDSLEEITSERFHKYNKYTMVDAGIGSTPEAISSHILRVKGYIKAKDDRLANRELDNLYQSLRLTAREVNPKTLAFAALVVKIDNMDFSILSEENINKIYTLLGKSKYVLLDRLMDSVKKKLNLN